MKDRHKLMSDEQWELVSFSSSPATATRSTRPSAIPQASLFRGRRPPQERERVIADRGSDSEPLRQRLCRRGIEIPYRKNNHHRRYEDKRKLRRYKRRWIVERTNAWLGQFPRLLVRHEYLLCTYRVFFYLASFWITL